jgi:iron complex transport system substrate-binding protein
MGLKMPGKVKEVALEPGYFAISQEVLGEYAGDYIILSVPEDQDSSFTNTAWFKDIKAVKNGHLYEVNANTFYFNDAKTLEYQLDFFEKKFLQ